MADSGATVKQRAADRLADRFIKLLIANGICLPVREYQFAPPRKWRFDFAWLDAMIAVEVEGGIFVRGRHVHPKGFLNDMEKYNTATRLGWRVLRWNPSLNPHEEGEILDFLARNTIRTP